MVDFLFNSDMKRKKGYAIFARDKRGRLMSIYESSFSMPWSTNVARVWDVPPTHYFLPQQGHFIVCTTRQHPDLYFTGRSDRRGNFEWKLK